MLYEPREYKEVSTLPPKAKLLVDFDINIDDYKIGRKVDKVTVLKLYNDIKRKDFNKKEEERRKIFMNESLADNQKVFEKQIAFNAIPQVEEFIGDDCCAMVLGDNIFYGNGFSKILKEAVANAEENHRASVFGYYVEDPGRFGVVEFDDEGRAISIEEKPEQPKSNYAVTGLYFYDNRVVEYAKQMKPSARGELEITDLNRVFLEKGDLDVKLLGRGFAWLDTGTMDSLIEAAGFVKTVENRQGIQISAIEEIAYKNGWIDKDKLLKSAERYGKSTYGQHLKKVSERKIKY